MWFRATACLVVLAVIALPAAADAQTTRPADARAARPPLELGAQTSLLAIFPGFGGLVSAPVQRGIALEAGIEAIPWMIEDYDEYHVLSQAQVRLPWAAGPRSRRSVVAGATLATVVSKRGRGVELLTTVLPHAGVSWQWRQTANVDLRLDLQALVPMGQPAIPAPRVALSIMGHRRGGRL